MEDKTTVVELNIEPTELFETIQHWATETKFSIYEKNEKRIIYFKNIRLNTAWLLIENQGENAKLNVWLAPKGMGPDATGNTWKGWKIAIPNGFAIGPVSVYKKQFNKLIEMLESRSKNIITSKSHQKWNQNQPKMELGILVKGLAAIGIINILFGVIGIVSASIYISSYPAIGNVSMRNGILDATLGIITLICSRMLKNGKVLAIWIYGASILLNVFYNVSMGHKLPYFSILFGAIIIWQFLTLKKEGKLS